MARTDARDVLRRLLEPVTAAAGLDLEDVEITPAGKRRVVRVVVDADGGVGLDAVAEVSQAVSSCLDENPDADRALGGAPYVLEVSSPGVDRPLTEPRHWRRAQGRLVRVALAVGGEVTGRVVRAGDGGVGGVGGGVGADVGEASAGGVVLDVGGVVRELAWAQVRRGRVQVEFTRPSGDDDVVEE